MERIDGHVDEPVQVNAVLFRPGLNIDEQGQMTNVELAYDDYDDFARSSFPS